MSGQPARSYLAVASAIVIAGVLISASLFIAVGGSPKTATSTITATITKTVTNTTTIVRLASAACLKEVPQDALFSSYSNSTSQGYLVTYSNGTKALFPLNSCPVPVTPDNYLADSTIQANPRFIVAENGSIYQATNACNCYLSAKSSNSTGQYAIFNFVLYSSDKLYPCGPNGYWTFNRLGLILVTIPINSTGGLQFSNAEFQSASPNIFMCTTTTS